MKDSKILKIRRSALRYCVSRGYVSYREDFAQYFCMRYYENENVNMKFVFVDFLRETFGDYRRAKGFLKSQSEKSFNEINDRTVPQTEDLHRIIEKPDSKWKLTPKQKLIHALVIVGYSSEEITEITGSHISTIYTHIRLIRLKIEKKSQD